MGKKRKKAWQAAPLCLFWTVCKEKNSKAFDNEGQSIQGFKSSFACNLWAWCKLHIVPSTLSFEVFLCIRPMYFGTLFLTLLFIN